MIAVNAQVHNKEVGLTDAHQEVVVQVEGQLPKAADLFFRQRLFASGPKDGLLAELDTQQQLAGVVLASSDLIQ